MLIGVFQLIGFPLGLIPLEVSDQIGGYRIGGLLAYFVPGIGWAALGVSFWKAQVPIVSQPAQY